MAREWDPVIVTAGPDVDEPMGSKEKFWIRMPSDQRLWLLKLARIDDRDGTVSGEDWAEWLVCRLARILGVPTAQIRPATLDDRRAILSRSVLLDGEEYLEHGNSVLSATFADYDRSVVGENPGYSPKAVQRSLDGVNPPVEFDGPDGLTAYDVWAGYLVLDAWIAGRDRHHENWAVVRRGDARRLAPSFDHGNALGFQERDPRRQRMLSDPAHLERWVERGRSQHFAGGPQLVSLATSAVSSASSSARAHWRRRLDAVSREAVDSALAGIPNDIMSEVTRSFVVSMLATNRRRLLDGYPDA